ncbi:hypothetical protein [Chryseobacterium sp.]|uniref:hypothetical protein n=1 Tax=Chryseobacterium sp. TaxID=1871047 RepID=UPI00289E4236|nr:hypothetical protein [Chryseobacterium sp.]
MKKLFVILLLIELLMGVFSYLTYDNEIGSILFSEGSISSTMKIFGPDFKITLFLNFLIIILTILFRKRKKILTTLFVFFFSLWFISGRTVGVQWTGEIYTGWFYLKFDKIILCPSSNGCSDVFKETSITDKPLYTLSLTNRFINEEIFVGPLLYPKLKKYLENPTVSDL